MNSGPANHRHSAWGHQRCSRAAAVAALLNTIAGCSSSVEPVYPKLGSVSVYVATTGAPAYLDSDGYSLTVDGNSARPIPPISAIAVSIDVVAGRHTLKLEGLADNCEVYSPNPLPIDVPLNLTVNVSFAIQCFKPVAYDKPSLIAYVSGAADSAEIYVIPSFGGSGNRLTVNRSWDGQPAWSPDGSKIAFASDRDGDREIYVMNADGTDQKRLTTSKGFDTFPAWSPDGLRIAFASERNNTSDEIYVMNADGTNAAHLAERRTPGTEPDWSPDGKHIAFTASDGIWVMDADGTNILRLTTNSREDYSPAWSPDGTRIAFLHTYYYTNDIYVVNADGTGLAPFTNIFNGYFENPSWSPDGRSIVYSTAVFTATTCFGADGEACDRRLRVLGVDGSTRELAARSPAYSPTWRR